MPASTDERLAAESVLDCVRGCRILADKGFIGGQSYLCCSRLDESSTFKKLVH
ncbi:hypothetical protein [Nostoc sp. FACHB-110]|uniref:hypothetical protein n=1 Tax=Nostoc sp. FACHB-110 TaxID=2692834 RepID=UPI001F55404C|nr:hypothetical protein [Nostoc sp. FACHB-110]